jgi:Uma2 family endonuclease
MSIRATHRFTVEDYYRMAETGVIPPDARVELLDGQIVDMMSIGSFHSDSVNVLVEHFGECRKGRWRLSPQNPVRISDHSVPQPDVTLLKPRGTYYRKNLPGPEDVLLLVEVSDSTADFDRNEKLPLYGKAGIVEVWIVNLPELQIEVYREPHFLGYSSTVILRAGDQIAPAAFPDAVISVAEVLGL